MIAALTGQGIDVRHACRVLGVSRDGYHYAWKDRPAPNQLWLIDITEHPTREGKICCCVVLDPFARKVVGWSIDTRQDAALATNALGW